VKINVQREKAALTRIRKAINLRSFTEDKQTETYYFSFHFEVRATCSYFPVRMAVSNTISHCKAQREKDTF
jgi:hypothetical protein